jgi:hypothetical protein
VNIYEQFEAMRDPIGRRAWTELEDRYLRACDAVDGNAALAVRSIDTTAYADLLTRTLLHASALAQVLEHAAAYWEFDLDNGWQSSVFFCTAYREESAGNDDWAATYDPTSTVEGPAMADFAAIYRSSWDATAEDTATNLYVIARTVAIVGRTAAESWRAATPFCAGYHDQSILFRITSS